MSSRMIAKRTAARRKQAIDWTGPLEKVHHREDNQRADKALQQINRQVNALLNNIRVKGVRLYEYVHQHGLAGVASLPDTEVKRAYFQFRSALDRFLKEDVDPTALKQFYSQYGQNPLDWRFIKTSGAKKASSGITVVLVQTFEEAQGYRSAGVWDKGQAFPLGRIVRALEASKESL